MRSPVSALTLPSAPVERTYTKGNDHCMTHNTTLTHVLQDLQHHLTPPGNAGITQADQRTLIRLLSQLLTLSAQQQESPAPDLKEVRGHEQVRRALEVAAAGKHNLLLVGPPRTGKSFLARTLASLVLSPASAEARAPFRAPPTPLSRPALVGSVDPFTLGELTLAHGGILLLEHLSTLNLSQLGNVQQAVEQHVVFPQGANHGLLPAHFLLVATIEPCPCGFYGDPLRECQCTTQDIVTYQRQLRSVVEACFDLHVEVPFMQANELLHKRSGENSAQVRLRVEAARERQRQRFGSTHFVVNSDLRTPGEIEQYCPCENASAEKLLRAAVQQLHLSAGETLRLQRVARSIADLAQAEALSASHLAEAIQYRSRFMR